MLSFLGGSEIRRQAARMTLAGMGILLTVIFAVWVSEEFLSVRRNLVANLTTQARIIGANCVVALSFENQRDAEEILSALAEAPNIVRAAVYSATGELFAGYARRDVANEPRLSAPGEDSVRFSMKRVTLSSAIVSDGRRIGAIVLQADLQEVYGRMRRFLAVMAFITAASLGIALTILARVQGFITRPLAALADLTRTVSRSKDYSLRTTVSMDGEIGILAFGMNDMLTQIQSRDRELEDGRQHLEEKVALRTAELATVNEQLQRELTERTKTEEQLRHTQKLGAVGRLAGGVAHDFNNILTAIIGYGNLLQMKIAVDDPKRHSVDAILAGAERAASLTQSLLAFSRKQVIKLQPLELDSVIDHMGRLLERLISEDIVLTIQHKDSGLTVEADSGQLEQVLMNLATNARDAMPGGGSLRIETSRMVMDEHYCRIHDWVKPGMYALIAVTDTGAGMDQDTASKIFEPFFTTKEVGKGTGLGLSIAHGIIKQHNGYINVHSEPRKGTAFKIYLPLVDAPTAQDKPRPHEPAALRGGSETILLAEDDAMLRKLATIVLEGCGYTVIQAVDGRDAVDRFREHRDRIQLVMLDGIMPKMNGKEAWKEIRTLKPGIKGIFISGYAEDIFTKEGIPDGEATFIQKPVSPTVLAGKVRDALDS